MLTPLPEVPKAYQTPPTLISDGSGKTWESTGPCSLLLERGTPDAKPATVSAATAAWNMEKCMCFSVAATRKGVFSRMTERGASQGRTIATR